MRVRSVRAPGSEGIDEYPFALAMVGVSLASGVAGKPPGPAHIDPVGGPVTGASESWGFDKGLGQDNGMAVGVLPV